MDAEKSLLIAGEWQGSGISMPVRNPFSGEIIDNVACATEAHVSGAIASGSRGAKCMAAMPAYKRSAILARASQLLSQDAERFAAMICAEAGKPIATARKEVARAVNTLSLSAEEAGRLTGETIAFDSFPGGEERSGYYIYEPLGLIVAITPFNDPLNLICHKLGPAFAAGNSVILKPAEQTPLVATMLGKLLLQAGLPADALNILTGYGADFGPALVAHPQVAMISFTGGHRTGETIARAAGLKKIAMELGANSPVIVTPDCDLADAANACAEGAFGASGQNCIGVQRIFVHSSIMTGFEEQLVAQAKAKRTGDPSTPETDIGPLIDKRATDRLDALVADAVELGAEMLCGRRIGPTQFEPIVLRNIPEGGRISKEEAFGPVVCLYPYTDLDHAIERANESDFAIHAAIFTNDISTAHLASRKLRAAGVMINDSTDYRLDAMPFGGAKRGNLGREGVGFAAREMSQSKVICTKIAS
jgi:glyceraldehyde-3-phosphate dehydrogenase (NADP+)